MQNPSQSIEELNGSSCSFYQEKTHFIAEKKKETALSNSLFQGESSAHFLMPVFAQVVLCKLLAAFAEIHEMCCRSTAIDHFATIVHVPLRFEHIDPFSIKHVVHRLSAIKCVFSFTIFYHSTSIAAIPKLQLLATAPRVSEAKEIDPAALRRGA